MDLDGRDYSQRRVEITLENGTPFLRHACNIREVRNDHRAL